MSNLVLMARMEIERLYQKAAREHVAGDVDRAATTRRQAVDALVRLSVAIGSRARTPLTSEDAISRGREAARAKAEERDVVLWQAALAEAGGA